MVEFKNIYKKLFLQLLLCYDLSLVESDGRFELHLIPVLNFIYS